MNMERGPCFYFFDCCDSYANLWFSVQGGSDEEWFFHCFFCIDRHHITMTKIENRNFALIFSGKRPFNTLLKIDVSDIVIFTMNFHQHLAWQMLDSNFLCHIYHHQWFGWSSCPLVKTWSKPGKLLWLYKLIFMRFDLSSTTAG